MTDVTHAIHATELLNNFGPVSAYTEDGAHEADATISTASGAGWLANFLVVSLDRTGTSNLIVMRHLPHVNQSAIDLLQDWIDEYGADLDSDLDQQLDELRQNRLKLRQS